MTEITKVTIEVDGRSLEAEAGAMLIQVTDKAGIPVPRFCYHKKLSVAANCRMCLVEVEGVPKPLPACATPVADGMRVFTRSPKALAAQKGTMEFLLINHPLDCPICDQGGECELQDVAMGYGAGSSRYGEAKRAVLDEDLGPLVATEMTRCIHCTRCVRFGAEIAGLRELGATGRGEHMRIGTWVEHTLGHELSGNIIDLCPVGALTAKPSRFRARAWELTQHEGIAPHDGIGSNIHIHAYQGRAVRVQPRENEAVNEVWISDRDRFSYEGLYSGDRVLRPRVKKDGEWQDLDWSAALELAAERLHAQAHGNAGQIAALASPSSTLEELYLLQRLIRSLGSPHIDSRLRQTDFRGDRVDPAFPWLGLPIAEVASLDAALVIGSRLRHEQPLLGHRLREAALNGARVTFLNPFRHLLTHPSEQWVAAPRAMLDELAGLVKALGLRAAGASHLVRQAQVEARHEALAETLKDADRALVLLGAVALAHPEYLVLKGLAQAVAEASGARLGLLGEGANGNGAALAGALPFLGPGARPLERRGAAQAEILAQPRKVCVLLGMDPGLDLADPARAMNTLADTDFVIALHSHAGPDLEAVADLILPVAGFAENGGTYVNAEGRWQSFRPAVPPLGEARPAWKVLRVLANLLDLEGFEYGRAGEVRAELESLCEGLVPDNRPRGEWKDRLPPPAEGLTRIGEVPIYAGDALVRRARSLQGSALGQGLVARLNPAEAGRLGLEAGAAVRVSQGGASAEMPLEIDPHIPEGCVWVPAAVAGSEALGAAFGPVNLAEV